MIMCKIDDFIDVTSRYIAELLDLRADIRPVERMSCIHSQPILLPVIHFVRLTCWGMT